MPTTELGWRFLLLTLIAVAITPTAAPMRMRVDVVFARAGAAGPAIMSADMKTAGMERVSILIMPGAYPPMQRKQRTCAKPGRMARELNGSGIPLSPRYDAIAGEAHDLGEPGAFPYGRGVRKDMYRGRLWTMRQYAGFATAAESN